MSVHQEMQKKIRRYDSIEELIRINVVKESDGCWRWIGRINTAGYGAVSFKGKQYRAHRLIYEHLSGPITGECLDHLCRNRWCCNPAHLEQISLVENTRRGSGSPALNARKTHCFRGHEFTPENTRKKTFPNGNFKRWCIECEKLRHNTRYPPKLRSDVAETLRECLRIIQRDYFDEEMPIIAKLRGILGER